MPRKNAKKTNSSENDGQEFFAAIAQIEKEYILPDITIYLFIGLFPFAFLISFHRRKQRKATVLCKCLIFSVPKYRNFSVCSTG